MYPDEIVEALAQLNRRVRELMELEIPTISGGGSGAPSPHALDSAHHSGILADSQIPAAIARDSEVTAAIAAHAGLPDEHHARQHVLNSDADHTGILPLMMGGTAADLSATGPGLLRQAGAGAAVSVLAHGTADQVLQMNAAGNAMQWDDIHKRVAFFCGGR